MTTLRKYAEKYLTPAEQDILYCKHLKKICKCGELESFDPMKIIHSLFDTKKHMFNINEFINDLVILEKPDLKPSSFDGIFEDDIDGISFKYTVQVEADKKNTFRIPIFTSHIIDHAMKNKYINLRFVPYPYYYTAESESELTELEITYVDMHPWITYFMKAYQEKN